MCTYWYALQKYFIILLQKFKWTDSCTHPTVQMSTRNLVVREFPIAAFTQLAVNSPFWKRLENVQFPACIKLLKSLGECWEIKWRYQPFTVDGKTKTWSAKPVLSYCALPKTALPDTPSLQVASGQCCMTPQTSSRSYSFLFHADLFQYRKLRPPVSQITVKQTTPCSPLCHAALAPSLAVSLTQEGLVPDRCCCPPWGPPCALPDQPASTPQGLYPHKSMPSCSWEKLLPTALQKGQPRQQTAGSFLCATWLYLLIQTCNLIAMLNFRKTN